MGYLDRFLVNNPGQNVSCDDIYSLWLIATHPTGINQITTADSDIRASMYVKEMVPDVEEWQYAGDRDGKYYFKFRDRYLRQQAQARLEIAGYPTELKDF